MREYKRLLTIYDSPFTLIRVGRDADGGYIVPRELIQKNLLSCGISNEISFELDYLSRLSRTNIHCFDGTISEFPSKDLAFNWHKMNIGGSDTSKEVSLNQIFDKCFPDGEVFVKMDIEESEYPAFDAISQENLSRISVFNFHHSTESV